MSYTLVFTEVGVMYCCGLVTSDPEEESISVWSGEVVEKNSTSFSLRSTPKGTV